MVNLTTLEAELLNIIAYDLYNQSNGSQPTSYNDVAGGVWTWSVSDSWPHAKRSLPGVVSSLVQKGLVYTVEDERSRRRREPGEPSEDTIGLTEAGYAAWQTVDRNSQPKPTAKRVTEASVRRMEAQDGKDEKAHTSAMVNVTGDIQSALAAALKPSKKAIAAQKAKMDAAKAEPVKPTMSLKLEDLLVICLFEKGRELERKTIEAVCGLGAETCYRVLRSLVTRGILTQRMHCGTRQLGWQKTAPVRVARFSLA